MEARTGDLTGKDDVCKSKAHSDTLFAESCYLETVCLQLAIFSYFILVAIPPRIWRSFLFISKISFTCAKSTGSSLLSLSLTSLCTVDLLIPNLLAAERTVALFSRIYLPSTTAL